VTSPNPQDEETPVGRAVWRGLKCRCPNCGNGRLFRHYLEQVDSCSVCGEPLVYYKGGILVPLVVITVVITIAAIVMLVIELQGQGSPLLYLYAVVPPSVVIPLLLLPSAKGGIVGLMWSKGWSDEQDR
jgi:uncharacterized protein (DUF983 family)